jgi:signal transduction histidine kinase
MDELVHPDLLGKPFIFDLEKNRVIAGRPTGRSVVVPPISPKLISHMGVSSGLAIPVETADFGGLVVVDGVPGLCSDHLAIAADVGREISAALERCSVLRASEDNAAARTRLALARDLHDSFVQILAGTSFRLEAIRQNAQSGKDVLGHIEGLQSVLSQQQRELRVLISQLRGEERASEKTDTQPGLRELAERLSRQWGLTCTVDCLGQVRPLPTAMQHEIHQLFRETVANAARHGKAAEVHLTLNIDSDFISLVVNDNGCGFPGAARGGDGDTHVELAAPRSLSERVRGAGGDIRVSSGPTGSTVTVRLPLERRV